MESQKTRNIGCGFILTSDQAWAEKIMKPDDSDWKIEEWQKEISFFEATKYQIENWEKFTAFHSTDIRWDELNLDPIW